MNTISICGLIPFLICGLKIKSHGMLIIFFNGLLFHYNPKNKIMYIIDLSSNCILYLINAFKRPFVFKSAFFCLFIFLLNDYFLKKNKYLNEIIHVTFVQGISFYTILQVYRIDKCESSLFIC